MLKKRLTNKQMDVMNILWENGKPMAASEILKANKKLNINTIHACIRKLLEEAEGLISSVSLDDERESKKHENKSHHDEDDDDDNEYY